MPPKLKLEKHFQPCPVEPGDELYPNGLFEFNITRLQAFVDAHADRFPTEVIAVADIPAYGGSGLDEEAVRSADLSQPILLAEIAPGRYNLIDGNHRVAKARRDGEPTVPARRIVCPAHVPFLTSTLAYEKYLEYWNSKLNERHPAARLRTGRRAWNVPSYVFHSVVNADSTGTWTLCGGAGKSVHDRGKVFTIAWNPQIPINFARMSPWGRHGFIPSKDDPLILFRSLSDIAASLKKAGIKTTSE